MTKPRIVDESGVSKFSAECVVGLATADQEHRAEAESRLMWSFGFGAHQDYLERLPRKGSFLHGRRRTNWRDGKPKAITDYERLLSLARRITNYCLKRGNTDGAVERFASYRKLIGPLLPHSVSTPVRYQFGLDGRLQRKCGEPRPTLVEAIALALAKLLDGDDELYARVRSCRTCKAPYLAIAHPRSPEQENAGQPRNWSELTASQKWKWMAHRQRERAEAEAELERKRREIVLEFGVTLGRRRYGAGAPSRYCSEECRKTFRRARSR